MTGATVFQSIAGNPHSVAALALISLATACGECTGTIACRVDPELSYSGQIIDHKSGAEVGGTKFIFVRDSGVAIEPDSVETIADANGYFTLRVDAAGDGPVHGHARIAAPPPYQPYLIPSLSLSTTRTKGDGGFLGRLTAKPFLILIGIVRDRNTQTLLGNVSVKIRRNSGGRLAADSITFTSDVNGQFAWYPDVLEIGTVNATFELTAPGRPRSYVFTREIPLLYKDGEESYQFLPVGSGFPYFGSTGRRGVGAPIAGTTVELTRISGVATVPQQVTIPTDAGGNFKIPLEPQTAGSLYVQLRILPPAPLPPETRQLAIASSDDDVLQWLGWMGYGAHAYFGAELRDEAGTLLPEATPVVIKRSGGLPLESAAIPSDGERRFVNSKGKVEYGAPTGGTGEVTFDLAVELPAPFAWDTIRGVSVTSRFNDTIVNLGPFTVRKRPRQ